MDVALISNEARHWLLPKKSKVMVMLYLLFISQYKAFNQLYITNKMERFSFKSGHAMRVYKRRPAYSVTVRILAQNNFIKVLSRKYWSIKWKN